MTGSSTSHDFASSARRKVTSAFFIFRAAAILADAPLRVFPGNVPRVITSEKQPPLMVRDITLLAPAFDQDVNMKRIER